MKRFKSYIIEVSNNSEDDFSPSHGDENDAEFQHLNDQLAEHLRSHYGKQMALGSEPEFQTYKDGVEHRKYIWSTWNHAVGSLANSIVAHHLAEGSLTGKKGTHEVTPEQTATISTSIIDKHADAMDQFKTVHREFLKNLINAERYSSDTPVISPIIEKLESKHGADFDTISDAHFTDYLNLKLATSQLGLNSVISSRPEIIPSIQDHTISAHNKQVMRHDHPLGLFLNGGMLRNSDGNHVLGPNPPSRIIEKDANGKPRDILRLFR